MTDIKTKAQNRLHKLQEALKESRKNQNNQKPGPSTGTQRLKKDLFEMACKKSNQNLSSRPVFSPVKEKLLKIMDIQIAKTTDRIRKSLLSHRMTSESASQIKGGKIWKSLMMCGDSLSDISMESGKCRKTGTLNYQSTKQRLLNNNNTPGYLESQHTHIKRDAYPSANNRSHRSKSAVLSSSIGGPAQQRLRETKSHNLKKDNDVIPKIPRKRKSDHEIFEKMKISKIQEMEETSRNRSVKKHFKNQTISSDKFETKFLSILDSKPEDCSPVEEISRKETIMKLPKSKDPMRNNRYPRKSDKSTPEPVAPGEKNIKEMMSPVHGQNDNEKDKPSLTSKTKIQARLKKILKSMKEREKSSNKGSIANEGPDCTNSRSNSEFLESMDWEPFNDDILRSTREEVDPHEELMEWQDINGISVSPSESNLCIVVDTNVLIKNIHLIKRLSKAIIRGFKITLLIPWQVLKELDNLKTKVDFKNVSYSARKAINMLSESTSNDKLNVAFQTQVKHFEECNQFVVEVPDDHLIKCCHQLKNKNQKVILLSNDINLRVKTITNNIQAVEDKWVSNLLNEENCSSNLVCYCFERIPEGYKASYIRNNCSDFIYKTAISLLTFLSQVLVVFYQDKYDDLWPLWIPKRDSLAQVLNFMTSNSCFESYWVNLKQIRNFSQKHKSYDDITPENVEWMGRQCICLARSMINCVPYDNVVQFFKDLSFLKSESCNQTDNNYISGSYQLAEKYFKDTEDSLNEFVTYLNKIYAQSSISLKGNKDVLHHIDVNLEVINQFQCAILKFQEEQGDIPLDCEVAKTLHSALCNFLGKKSHDTLFPIFSPEDIVEYVNQNRNFFQPALAWLAELKSSLYQIQSTLI